MKSVFDSSDGGKSVPEKCLHIGLILWPRYSLLAVSGLLEALRYAAKAQDKLAFKISLISEFPDIPIISNAGIIMRPDSPHAPPLIGIGTGSFVLAQEGLLNERRASIHPFHLDAFRQAFPLVYAEQGYDFIDDGDVLTCPGGISTLTLATELIRAHAGDDIASTTCQRLSLVPHEIATPRPANFALIPDSRLRRAVMLIEQFLTRPLTTAGLAREVALSERQLNRLFHAEFGKTAREFIRSARLRYACWLLKNSQQSVTDIAQRMGFSDCAHFIRHFQTEYGCTPGVWRTSQS